MLEIVNEEEIPNDELHRFLEWSKKRDDIFLKWTKFLFSKRVPFRIEYIEGYGWSIFKHMVYFKPNMHREGEKVFRIKHFCCAKGEKEFSLFN